MGCTHTHTHTHTYCACIDHIPVHPMTLLSLSPPHQSSWLQLPSRDYTPSDVRPSWKTPPTPRDTPWSQSSLSSRSKLVGTDGPPGSEERNTTETLKDQFLWLSLVEQHMTVSLMQTESEHRLGTYSGLVGSADDGDTKRAKLSYMSRTSAYTRSPSSSLSSSSYCTPSPLTSTSGTPPPSPPVSRISLLMF